MEAYRRIGCIPPIINIRHENSPDEYMIGGLLISDGQMFARIYQSNPLDDDSDLPEYITVEDLAFEWIYCHDGSPVGVVE